MGKMKELSIMYPNIHVPVQESTFEEILGGTIFFQEETCNFHFIKANPYALAHRIPGNGIGCAYCSLPYRQTWNAINAVGSSVHFCPTDRVWVFMEGYRGA